MDRDSAGALAMGPAPDPRPDWQDSAHYHALAGIDRAGLAWEWLRRDAGYAALSARLRCDGGLLVPQLATEADARAYGLCFRGEGQLPRARGAPAMACGPRPVRA